MDNANLNSFLKLGYFLDYSFPGFRAGFNTADPDAFRQMDEHEFVAIGVEKYKKAIEREFVADRKHVLPLSGGLDSRGVLATLLEFTEARNIEAYTFWTLSMVLPCEAK